SSTVPPLDLAPPSPPSLSPSPPTSSSPSPLPPPLLSIPSPLPAPEEHSPQPQPQLQFQPQPQPLPPQPHPQPHPAPLLHQSLPPSPSPPALPSPSPPPPTLPPSATPPPSSSPPLPMELLNPSPPSPPTPEDTPTSQITSLHLAKKQDNAAIAGESEEEDSESGGEGIFRERDEFVVRTEDIGTLKLALQTGREPPPIWRVQKALLQKFAPEIKDGQRQFCATSNYLGYFGDAKMRYQRLYVKFLENVNKKDYVRVCSRKPWHRAGIALRRQSLAKPLPTVRTQTPPRVEREEREKARERERQREREQHEQREREREKLERKSGTERGSVREDKRGGAGGEKRTEKARSRTVKVKAEPPPKKRKKWLKEVPSSGSDSSLSGSEDEGSVRSVINSRAMREMFRSYVEMLVSTALDPDMIQALEDTNDELYLPPMRKIDSILNEQKRRLVRRVSLNIQHQEALHMYPQMSADALESGMVKVRLGGEGYNRKTLNRVKKSVAKQQVTTTNTKTR
ncbi:proline-rich protein 12, partial [Tachysurus ichikawai]